MSEYNDNFLDLLDRKLDQNQYAALSAQKNTVIAAGAGSGKTQVLATRFAWLVMTKQAKAEQILTLTFTNKAASEMYDRIYRTLKLFAEHEVCENLTVEQKTLAQQALESFSDVHIQTLDSYCSSIVRQCANRYGIKPDFVTGSADGQRQVKDLAFTYILQNAENQAVQAFCEPGKLQEFAEHVFAKIILENTSLATKQGWFTEHFEIQTQKIAQAWNELIIGKTEDSIFKQVSEISDALEASGKKDDKKYAVFVSHLVNLIEKTFELCDFPKLTKDDIKNQNEKLQQQIDFFEKYSKIGTKKFSSGFIKEIRSLVTKFADSFEQYTSILNFIRQYKTLKELNLILDDFLAQVNTSKRISGNLTFNDVSELALKFLLENEDLRNQEKNSYKKIMIDEFQDNNGKNRDLLYILSLKNGAFEDNGNCKISVPENKTLHSLIKDLRSPDKLFFVGDEKQSIYKFRGADVQVFNELTSSGENDLIYMTFNYRSDAALVKAFNELFKNGNGIFALPEPKLDYEAYYTRDAAKNGIELPRLTKQNIPIHACLLEADIYSENEKELPENRLDLIPEKDQKAYFMAKKIYELHEQGSSWNEFAILDRSRKDRDVITKYLALFGIPYSVDIFKDIFTDAIINDFCSFLRICVYPSDARSYAAYLCSPLAGLSENETEMIISNLLDCDSETFNPLAAADKIIKNDIGQESFNKYQSAKEFYIQMRSKALQERLTTTLSVLWQNRAYRYETMQNEKTILCTEHFDMLFELARQAEENGKTAAWFIDQLELLKQKYLAEDSDLDASEVSYPIEREQAVQIMTIHKSKGLEFEHVFVYGCTNVNSKSEKEMFFFDEETGVSIKPQKDSLNYFFLKQSEKAKLMELAEFRRQIYVAITRAKKAAYIIGSYKNTKKTQSIMRLFENKIATVYPPEVTQNCNYIEGSGFDYFKIEPVEYKDLPKSNFDSQKYFDEKTFDSIETISFSQNPIERKTPSSLESDFDSKVESQDYDFGKIYEQSEDSLQPQDFSAVDFGILVHSYLEMQANRINPEIYEPEPKFFKNLTESQIKENKELCIKMCRDFSESELGISLKQAQTSGRFWRAEWAFRMFYKCSTAPKGAIFTGAIDLIFENPDGTFTICDYKSDSQINGELYRAQQECYRAAASKILNISEDKISLNLYYLRHNQIVEL